MYTIVYQLIFPLISDNAWIAEEVLPSNNQIFKNIKPSFSENKS